MGSRSLTKKNTGTPEDNLDHPGKQSSSELKTKQTNKILNRSTGDIFIKKNLVERQSSESKGLPLKWAYGAVQLANI